MRKNNSIDVLNVDFKSYRDSIKLIGIGWSANHNPQIDELFGSTAHRLKAQGSRGQATINPKIAQKAFGGGRIGRKAKVDAALGAGSIRVIGV